ncbi:hypothetical protein J2I46_30000 [Fibrella sp. HMF5405]|uniref:Uncharacterized protein n=1 Tax=Fibrella forsythiae TaxID=2817061 RepID=A0ABS3JVA4_9BACT|nr:hypothetical protein [Fibrella forsythiae]
MGLPLGTVKTRHRFALQQLRRVLRQDIHHYHKSASIGVGHLQGKQVAVSPQ